MMTLHEYINLLPVASNHKEMRQWGKTRPRPAFVCGKEVKDDDINLLSLANYILLASAGTDKKFISMIQEIFTLPTLYDEDAHVALGYIAWVAQSIEKISKMFAKAHIPPTDEERQAGVESLKFGFFGIIDWYARRMGINHDEAEQTAWVRVYKCLDMETKQELYERRLIRVREKKAKAKAKKGRRR